MALTPDGSDGVYLQVHGSSRPRGDFDLVLYCAPGVAAKFDKRSELWFNATIDVVELEDRKVRVGATAEVIRDWQTELYRRETPEGR